jgi:hypothetical protein
MPTKPPARPDWLLFVLTLQGHQKTARMRVWRALKTLGAVVLRDGVYLLPNRDALRTRVEALEKEIAEYAGSTQILEVDARHAAQARQFQELFDHTPDYQGLMDDIRRLHARTEKLKPAVVAQRLARLQREFGAVAALDYFPSEAANQTRRALEDLTVVAARALSPDEPHSVPGRISRVDVKKYEARVWATRQRPWADRLGSAWLIGRFIDKRAKFLWLATPKDCPKRAIGFDFDGAAFTHVGGKVTFEVLLESFALQADAGLRRIAALIHYLDVGGVPVAEAAGLESMLRGARDSIADDDALLAAAVRMFDLLYVSYSKAGDEAT